MSRPFMFPAVHVRITPIRPYSSDVTITNPLVLYRALLATNKLSPDPAQHRLAIHLQKLYDRLKDYEPTLEYSHQLHQLSKTIDTLDYTYTRPPSTLPTLSTLFTSRPSSTTSLTKVFTNHDSAFHQTSPKGLLLHGEVGTGKSMLVDLFADCLPTSKKRRWHYNTFILETFANLEKVRKERLVGGSRSHDHSILILARDLIKTSPILFLDEFQLPDRAASKTLSNLLTSFFHLGGVLIATSNRMPDELVKASGMEFRAPPRVGIGESLKERLGFQRKAYGNVQVQKGEFADFVEVLKARCEVYRMEGGRDYRRLEHEEEEDG
ncbi:hypothetical protein HK097_003026, partial [Rhizophlyctis rosea]